MVANRGCQRHGRYFLLCRLLDDYLAAITDDDALVVAAYLLS